MGLGGGGGEDPTVPVTIATNTSFKHIVNFKSNSIHDLISSGRVMEVIDGERSSIEGAANIFNNGDGDAASFLSISKGSQPSRKKESSSCPIT